MAIPLSNPMVSSGPAIPLNDTTNAGQTTANTAKVVDWTSAASVVDWSTPRKASDLCGQLKLFTELSPDHNTQRLLFRKVKKAFSEKSFLLASSQQQVRVLEARVKRMAPRKKKSVQTDPNTKFANIRDIKRAQEDAGERLISPSRIAEVELPSEGSGCIVVAVEGS
ncbi:transposase [Colletotrichum nymphaeae SA-01]|uniref:Transposase n=1 Tax=Colletotrichum nymphaeae SA-01 TaxID=1460502 RepID=A0A135TG70_9PEZI|nr:transposase [Colletotrichum nymphaeae SA-01]